MMKYSLFTKLFVTLILFMGMSCELVHARKRSVSEMNAIAVSVFSNEENVTRTMLNTDDNFISPLSISVKSKEIEELKTIIGSEEVFYIYTLKRSQAFNPSLVIPPDKAISLNPARITGR